MAGDPLAFFTLDRGTASTAAALIAPVGGRFRLLAADAQPAGPPAEALLERLVAEVSGGAPDLLPGAPAWATWARLEVATAPARRAIVAAPDERRLAALETAVVGAGWRIAGRLGARMDLLEGIAAGLRPDVELLVVAASDQPSAGERIALVDLLDPIAALLERRPGLMCLLAGGAAEAAERWSSPHLVLGPAPTPAPAAEPTALGTLLLDLAGHAARDVADGRRAFATAIASLAALLEQRVEGVDVGCAGGLRVAAGPHGVEARLFLADGGLVPPALLDDDRLADAVLAWSTVRDDAFMQRDRLRNLGIWPWRDAAGDGAHLRAAAAHAALARLEAAWAPRRSPGESPEAGPDLIIASGGCFAVLPPAVTAMTLLDTLRRPGGVALALDHARLLAPLGSIADEDDRRRMLVDLMDDGLLPLGSGMVVVGARGARHAGTLKLAGPGAHHEAPLVPGAVQRVPLAAGQTALAELETREGGWLGVRAHRAALPVTGGLGGFFIDTRDVPLHLPERADRRRDLLAAWQRPLWPPDR